MPTNGRSYQAWVNDADDVLIQRAAADLCSRGVLRDDRNRLIAPKSLPGGGQEFPRYALTKFLLRQLASGRFNGVERREHPQTSERSQRSEEVS